MRSAWSQTPQVAVTELGQLHPTDRVTAVAINDSGAVAGNSGSRAFLWQHGRMLDLGALPPMVPEDPGGSQARGLNDLGLVVGSSGNYRPVVMSGLQQSSAVLFRAGKIQALSDRSVGCEAAAINKGGTVVGVSGHRGFVSVRGGWQELAPLSHLPAGNECWANGVNDASLIVGVSTVPGSTRLVPRRHACLWQNGRPLDLGALPNQSASSASAVASNGWVVGSSGGRAVVWKGRRPQALAPLPDFPFGQANALNAAGLIVGSASQHQDEPSARAVLWRDGGVLDLNALLERDSGWVLQAATGVNVEGQIVGNGTLNGQPRAFLLDLPH